jgi:hypothetical protein
MTNSKTLAAVALAVAALVGGCTGSKNPSSSPSPQPVTLTAAAPSETQRTAAPPPPPVATGQTAIDGPLAFTVSAAGTSREPRKASMWRWRWTSRTSAKPH